MLAKLKFLKLKNVTVWLGALATFAAFWPPALLLERQRSFEIYDGVIAATAASLALGHIVSVWRSMKMPVREIPIQHVYVIGLFSIGLAVAMIFGGLWAWRDLGKPDWIADHLFGLFWRFLLSVGLFLALFVNLSDDGQLTINAFWRSASLAGAAAGLSAVLALLSR